LEKKHILTTQELADYLKLNEKTIIKMAQSGDLPGFKVGNQWRFYLSTIDEYMQDKIVKSSKYDFSRNIQTGENIMPLSRLIDESCISLSLKAKNSEGVLYELAGIAQKSGVATSLDNLLIQMKKREQMLSTSIGRSIAIPHPRNPSDNLFTRAAVIVGRSNKGIDFASPDNKKVHLFFMPCAPDVVIHLKLLSNIAKLLETKGTIQRFLIAKTTRDIMKTFLKAEKAHILSSGSL